MAIYHCSIKIISRGKGKSAVAAAAYRHYDEDDGYSGTNFNRPGFQRMLADIKAGKMYQCRTTNFTEEQKYFICSTYRKGKELCSTHTIRNVVLHEIVLKNLREAIQYVREHEAEFMREAADNDMRDKDAELMRKRDAFSKAEQRIAELDLIISRLYEDNVTGKLTDERFIKLSHDYEREQSNLKSMAEVLRKELKHQEQQKTA